MFLSNLVLKVLRLPHPYPHGCATFLNGIVFWESRDVHRNDQCSALSDLIHGLPLRRVSTTKVPRSEKKIFTRYSVLEVSIKEAATG